MSEGAEKSVGEKAVASCRTRKAPCVSILFPNAGASLSQRVSRQGVWAFLGLAFGISIFGLALQKTGSPNAVNPDAALTEAFQKRVVDYVKLHNNAEAKLTRLKKPTTSPAKIQHYQHELREAIVRQRPHAIQGNIFTPEISREFQRLIGLAYQGDATTIKASMLHAEPGTRQLRVRVNRGYPSNMPLQSMPASLLSNLPPLPPELEYRAVGGDLVLRDVGANLIVDMIPGVIPT